MLPAQTRYTTRHISRALGGPTGIRFAAVGIGVTALFVGALLTLEKSANSRPIPPKITKNAHTSHTASSVAVAPSAHLASASRRSVQFYTGDVRANMFSEPVTPAPPEMAPVSTYVRPAPMDPFADWNYTGTFSTGGVQEAVLENVNTHEGRFVHVGEDVFGKKVASFDGSMITFGTGPTAKSMSISMLTSYTPLSASAGFMTAKPADNNKNNNVFTIRFGPNTNANAAPANGPSVTLPNGRVLSGNALTRYNNRINRGWNGNPGGGR